MHVTQTCNDTGIGTSGQGCSGPPVPEFMGALLFLVGIYCRNQVVNTLTVFCIATARSLLLIAISSFKISEIFLASGIHSC